MGLYKLYYTRAISDADMSKASQHGIVLVSCYRGISKYFAEHVVRARRMIKRLATCQWVEIEIRKVIAIQFTFNRDWLSNIFRRPN